MKLLSKEKNISSLFNTTIAIFFLLAKITSWKLWLANRTFPLIPAFDFLQIVPPFLHLLLYVGSIVLLLLVAIKPKQFSLLPILITIEILSCLLDQNRWQPWEYQYVFMFFILWVNRGDDKNALSVLLIVLCSIYFYSGLQKVNPHFIKQVWGHTILNDFLHLSTNITQQPNMLRLGYVMPLLEMLLGIGLLFKKSRKIAIYVLLIMHILILLFIGPLGLCYNIIVWPWNMAMIVFLIIFLKQSINTPNITSLIFKRLNLFFLVVWIVFPVLNFWGYWDFYFSSSLYSGRIDICYIELNNPDKNFELKEFYKKRSVIDTVINKEIILLQDWAFKELNTPPCPQARVYKKIKTEWRKRYPNVNVKFWFYDRSHSKVIKTQL